MFRNTRQTNTTPLGVPVAENPHMQNVVLTNTLFMRDHQIAALHNALGAQAQENAALREQVAADAQEIAVLRNALAMRDQENAVLHKDIANMLDRDQRIATLEKRNHALNADNVDLRAGFAKYTPAKRT